MKPFSNPYLSYEGECARLNAIIPREKHERVKRCRLQGGTIQCTLAILWEKLINELDRLNITDCTDSERFEQFVTECSLTDGNGGTPLVAVPEANVTNDGRGTEARSNAPTSGANVGTNVPRNATKGEQRVRRSAQSGKKEKGKCVG